MVSNQKSQLCALLLATVALAAPQLVWVTLIPCLLLLSTPNWQISKWWNRAVDDPRMPPFLQMLRAGGLPLPGEVSAHMACKKHRACRFSCRRFQEAGWVQSRTCLNMSDNDKKDKKKGKKEWKPTEESKKSKVQEPKENRRGKVVVIDPKPDKKEDTEVVTTTGFCNLAPFPLAHPNVAVMNGNVVGCCFSCGISFVMTRHTTDKPDGGAKGLLACQGCTHHYRLPPYTNNSNSSAREAGYATGGRLLVTEFGDMITACFCKRLGCQCETGHGCTLCLPWTNRKKGSNVPHALKDIWLIPAQQCRQFALDVVVEENAARATQQETGTGAESGPRQPILNSGASAVGQVNHPAPPSAPPAAAAPAYLAISRGGKITTV